ncbi:uncharacterized protein FA14DRAFT_152990 [Meira miltonrushii]|uniref:Uncharacterized protein n=1 Tax=Meira miltonrushii TaxID=1280837 RepID=A0A316VJ35_9BASI|nr:uncharacterized protein FA14DRAFT_152990 [Meira miltonrushii]PWN37622.1 hypothetical protein FA14DRAFT_152990 [Meira miltonrushii]
MCQSTIIEKRSNSHSGGHLKTLEKALMDDSGDESRVASPHEFQKVYDSYRSVIASVPETGKALHDPYKQQKIEEKSTTKESEAKIDKAKSNKPRKSSEEVRQRKMMTSRKWRETNREKKNEARRATYAKAVIEAGGRYVSREERTRMAITKPRTRKYAKGYYGVENRHKRRVDKSISKKGMTKEEAIEEANQHFQKLNQQWRRKL